MPRRGGERTRARARARDAPAALRASLAAAAGLALARPGAALQSASCWAPVGAACALEVLDQPARWARFDAEVGLRDPRVLEVDEGPDGSVWVATETGVAWYDGFEWHPLGREHGVPEMVTDLAVGASGRVVCVSEGAAYLGDAEGFEPLLEGVEVLACERLASGSIGLLASDGARHALRIPEERRSVPLDGVAYGGQGVLCTDAAGDATWVGTDRGLFRLSPGGWERRAEVPPGSTLSRITIQDGSGRGLAHLQLPWQARGIWEWDGTGRFTALELPDAGELTDVQVFAGGEAVLATESERLYVRRAGRWTLEGSPPAEMRGARLLRRRANGDLWVATEDGLSLCRAEPPMWRHVEHGGGLRGSAALQYLAAADGTVWIGKRHGLEARRADGTTTTLDVLEGRPLDTITALGQDGRGHLWVGSGLGELAGAYRFDGAEWVRFDAEDGLELTAIHRIRADRSGRPWFLGLGPEPMGTSEPGAYVLGDAGFERWDTDRGLPSGRVYDFLEAADGAYWFATLGGVARWADGRWHVWTADTGLRCSRVYALCEDAGGSIWLGHERSSRGLGRIGPDGAVSYTREEDAAARAHVSGIALGPEGRLWVATDQGVFVRHPHGWTRFTGEWGLPGGRVRAILPRRDEVLVATSRGGTSVLALPRPERSVPRVAVDEPLIGAQTVRARWSVRSPWRFPPEDCLRTRCRVDGGPWTPWSAAREAVFEGVAYGDHTLEVAVMHELGSEPPAVARRAFTVTAPPLRRPPVVLALALAAVVVALFGHDLLRRGRRSREVLTESEARFRQLAESVREVFWLTDWKAGRVLYVSPTYEVLTGRPVETLYADARAWIQQIHRDDRREAVERYLSRAAGGGYEHQYRLVRGDGEVRWVRARAFPIRDAAGDVYRIAGIAEDVTVQHRAAERLRQSEERYRLLVEEIPEAIVIHRRGSILYANPAAVALFGVADLGVLLGRSVLDFHHPASRELAVARMRWIEREGRNTQPTDMRLLRADGTVVDVEVTGGPVMFDGQPAIQAIAHDITERKRAEEHKTLLLRELDHRVKNNLAGVLALSQQTMARARDLPEFERAFTGRIRAMARTHEALAATRWGGVGLPELVRLVVTPYDEAAADERVVVDGADVVVRPEAATPLCMALHELATNAAKYGALSVPGGRVEIRWTRDEDGALQLRWLERGGPPVEAPQRDGFGLPLVRGVIEHELLGGVDFAFDGDGLACAMWIPRERLERPPPGESRGGQ